MPSENLNVFVRLRGLREFTRQTRRASLAAGLISGRWNLAGRRMTTGTALMYRSIRFIHRNMLGLATVAGLAGFGILKGFMDFEAQMRRVAAVTVDSVGQVEGGLQTLTDAAIREASQFSFSNEQAAESLYILASAGFSAQESMDALHGTMSLAQATSATLQQSTYLQTAAINTFGVAAKDASKVADLLTVAVQASALEVGDLGYSFKYAAGPAQTAGVSITDLSTALMVMAQGGVRGQRAGTALRMSFRQLIAPTAQAKGAMEKLGLTTQDMVGPGGGLKRLGVLLPMIRERLNKLPKAQRAATTAALVGVNAWSGFQTLLNQSPKFWDKFEKKTTKAFGNVQSEADISAKKTQQSTKAALENMGNMVQGFFIAGLMKYSPQIQAFLLGIGHWFQDLGDRMPQILAFLTPFWETFTKLWSLLGTIIRDVLVVVAIALIAVRAIMPGLGAAIEFVNENWDYFRVVILGIGGILAAIFIARLARSVIMMYKFARAFILVTITLVKQFGIIRGLALMFATNPLTIWIIAIGALIILVVLAWKRFKWFRDAVGAAIGWINDRFWEFVNDIKRDFWSAVNFIIGAWNRIRSAFWVVINFIRNNWQTMILLMGAPIAWLVLLIINSWDTIRATFWTVVDAFRGAWNAVVSFFQKLPGRFVSAAAGIGRAIVNGIITALNYVIGGINSLLSFTIPVPLAPDIHIDAPDLPKIPLLGMGGISTMAGVAVVGEEGPELVHMSRGARVDPLPLDGPPPSFPPGAGMGGFNGTIETTVELDGKEIAHATHKYVQSKAARR